MDKNLVDSMLAAGAATAGVLTAPDGGPVMLVPPSYTVQSLESHLPHPLRKKGVVTFSEAASFARYVTDFKTPSTAIFATLNETGGSFLAVMNYHEPGEAGEAGWSDHKAAYNCPASVEWKRWLVKNRELTGQGQFAEFIEDCQGDIVEPSAATILEIATTLRAKIGVDFKSGVRLQNGTEQLVYEENAEATAGVKGEIVIPSQFKIGVPLFVGGDRYAIDVRLRYRIREKRLLFQYELINPHLVVRDACDTLVEKIHQATKIDPYIASAS